MIMKATGYKTPLPIGEAESLVDFETPQPVPTSFDLLVAIKAISVNPVDTKVRLGTKPAEAGFKILGWDAAGVVVATGPECRLFKEGDEVYYAGSIGRQGVNAEYHLVDERIVGHKPKSLDFVSAAALPLTSITAWELLFHRFGVRAGKPADEGALLITGGAGGVGSMLIQLARRITGLTVIATASRPETKDWCLKLGAHHVVDHSQPLPPQLQAVGIPEVQLAASLTATDQHFNALIELLAPQGKLGVIDDPPTLNAKPLKRKSLSLHWELMFTRSIFATPDMIAQHKLLEEVASLVDEGLVRTTLQQKFGAINAANLKRAHALIESGRSVGKVVLSGF